MKKVISITLVLLLLMSVCVLNTSALEYNGFKYTEDDGKAVITGYIGADTDLVIPATLGGLKVEEINDNAFYQNDNITSVTIENGIKEIGDKAFYNCTALTKVTIPDSVTELGDSAFSYCVYLTDVTLGKGVDEISNNCFSHDTRLESIVIPEGVKEIDDGAFEECTHLSSVSLPLTLEEIGKYAFAYTYNLKSIELPYYLRVIDEGAFYYNSALTEITFPPTVTSLSHYAFYGNSALESASLNEGLLTIGDLAFDGTALKSLYVPSTVVTIGSHPFGYNYSEETFEYSLKPDFEALCIEGSYGQQFCDGFGIKYSLTSIKENPPAPAPKPTEPETTAEIEILKGDVNYDGRVNEIDITLIQNHLAYLRKLEKYDLQVADFDSSGIVNVKDITQIQVRIK